MFVNYYNWLYNSLYYESIMSIILRWIHFCHLDSEFHQASWYPWQKVTWIKPQTCWPDRIYSKTQELRMRLAKPMVAGIGHFALSPSRPRHWVRPNGRDGDRVKCLISGTIQTIQIYFISSLSFRFGKLLSHCSRHSVRTNVE